MKHALFLPLLVACAVMAWAQNGPPRSPGAGRPAAPYQPAVPAATTINSSGGWPGYSTPTTAAGSAMNGMASVISAKGDYNLSTSAAAVNMTEAQRNEIQNRQQWTNTYFEMQATNKAAREAQAGPHPSAEQLAIIARQGVPKPLSPNFINPVSGEVAWPSFLQSDLFASQRAALDQLLLKQATYGSLSYAEQTKARQAGDAMFAELKTQIRNVPTEDYLASRDFLRSVVYTACKSDLN